MPDKIFNHILILKEVIKRLEVDDIVFATTAIYFHKIIKSFDLNDFNLHTVILGCLRLALKSNEQNRRVSELICAYHKTIHKDDKPQLEFGDCLEKLQNSVRNSELFVVRLLKFDLSVDLPYLHLLRIGQSLMNWIDWGSCGLAAGGNRYRSMIAVGWALITDCYFCDLCVHYSPIQIATSALYFALKIENIPVHFEKERSKPWYKVISPEITDDVIKNISSKMIMGYILNNETAM